MQSKFNLMVFVIASIFLLSLVSAQNTLVFGKVYKNSDVSDTGVIAGATVTATCGGITLESQTSTSEGYVFLFSDSDCKNGDSVTVKAVNGDWKGQDVGTARPCDSSSNCDDVSASFVAVANPILVEQKKSSGGSKGGSSGGSSSGGTVVAKPVNKTNVTVVKTATTNITVNTSSTDPIVLGGDVNETGDNGQKGLSGVTGYSILGGSGSWISVIVLLIIVIIVILIIRSIRNRK